MKRICHAILIALIAIHSFSYASPLKRLIIQLPTNISEKDKAQLIQQLDQLVVQHHSLTQQDSRWLLSLPADTSSDDMAHIIAEISTIKTVLFVEEDRLMKPMSRSQTIKTQTQ